MVYLLMFLGGLAGSLHWVGMCGGFPLAAAAPARSNLPRQLLYNLGRLNTLAFIGALSAASGATTSRRIAQHFKWGIVSRLPTLRRLQ